MWELALLLVGQLDRWRRGSLGMSWIGLATLCLLGFIAIPDALLRSLENRYPAPTRREVARHTGMLVLGGITGHPDLFLEHGQLTLVEAAERMSAPVGLMRQHPKLELVISGGEGRLLATGTTEAELERALWVLVETYYG